MKADFVKKFGFGIGCMFAVLLYVLICGLSWIATCGVVWLVCLLCGFTYNWGVATAVWIIAIFISGLFNGKKGSE